MSRSRQQPKMFFSFNLDSNMNGSKLYLIIAFSLMCNGEAARILSFLLVPSKSHNVLIRPILEELLRRGHEIVTVTVDPIYKNQTTPENLTEIDIHYVSYSATRQEVLTSLTNKKTPSQNIKAYLELIADIFEKQIQTPEVQKLLNDKSQKFDLLFLDASARISVVLSHVFKTPVIRVGTTGAVERHNTIVGVTMHPILYPQCFRQRLYNLTMWEKIKELYEEYLIYRATRDTEDRENQILKQLFGPDTPTVEELEQDYDMFFYGDQPIWEDNRPVPPSVIYIGGANKVPEQPLPHKYKKYLDSSLQDIIYISFGNNINTFDMPVETIQLFTTVFSNLPYNVCWKWDSDKFPVKSPNIKTFKWLPQADFLRHPKVKLFITHAGLRSTEDAIEAGVPMIGIPMFLDQFYNAEKYVRHGIGLRLDKETLTEQQLIAAINTIMTNKSYEQNVMRLRNVINDQPMSALERAVWWTEHVLRHGGARHMRARGAGIEWREYYEYNLIITVLFSIVGTVVVTVLFIYIFIKLKLLRKRPKRKVF